MKKPDVLKKLGQLYEAQAHELAAEDVARRELAPFRRDRHEYRLRDLSAKDSIERWRQDADSTTVNTGVKTDRLRVHEEAIKAGVAAEKARVTGARLETTQAEVAQKVAAVARNVKRNPIRVIGALAGDALKNRKL
jgi:hypothetical protein